MARKPTAAKKRRDPLSRERVLRAALEIADKEGIDALSMRRLGEDLGVKAMSLYKHVPNKDAVLDGMVDIVVGEITLPAIGGDWRAEMRKRAISAHQILVRHPWATMLVVSRMNVGPAMLRYLDATIGCLRKAGFSFAMTDYAWNGIDSYVYGFTFLKLNYPIREEDYAKMAKAFLPMIPEETYPYMNEGAREVAERKHDGILHLEFGLDLILDGLARLLSAGAGNPGSLRKLPKRPQV